MYSDRNEIVASPMSYPSALQMTQEGRAATQFLSSSPIASNSIQSSAKSVCVQQLIELQVTVLGEKTALVMGEESLSYNELNQRANQLAYHLQSLGVGPEVLVGICMERSLNFIVGLLGILKAGGAYVPLDASYPAERLAFMLEDSQVSVLLTQKKLLERLPESKAHKVCLDTESELLERYSTENPLPATSLENLIYVIYTSGSTGRPKGVEITHAALLNLVNWHHQAFGVSADARATQVASPSFDAAGWEIWPYLTIGSTIYLPDEETRVTPLLLRDWLIENEITHSFLPTLLAESLLSLEWPTQTALRYLLTGADMLHQYPSASLPFLLVNNYGPTENAVVTTSGVVSASMLSDAAPSIGRPISNTEVYILDDQLQLVPPGMAGEIYIGGAGLARGYHRRPELTAERFIQHPFSQISGARLYKTGDLARFLPDGQIAFLGRSDQQVKIRGYRIELGEIACALDLHSAIQAGVVIAREDQPGDKRLVAYLILAEGQEISVVALREHLLQHLPEYMLPTAFIVLDSFPLTVNGKLDRDALPRPDEQNTLRDQQQNEPMSLTEQRISRIVCTLLHLNTVDLDENFFMLGGHSLLGTQIIARVSEAFGVALSLRALFESPTVRDLAAEVERQVLKMLGNLSDEEVMRLMQQHG
jgi:amino acid adenylation domain-containing protein